MTDQTISESIGTSDAAASAPLSPMTRTALHEQVIGLLRNLILEGEIAPGARIAERQLCEQLGISRTPLREALKVLAAEGLVQLRPHRGAVVTRLSLADINHAFLVMESLEALAGDLACRHISDEQLLKLHTLQAEMRGYYRAQDRPAYFRLNQQIHQEIVKAAGNPVLTEVYANLSRRILQARYMANFSPERWRQAIEEHEDILAALEARDGERLSRILRQHLEHKREAVADRLTTESTG